MPTQDFTTPGRLFVSKRHWPGGIPARAGSRWLALLWAGRAEEPWQKAELRKPSLLQRNTDPPGHRPRSGILMMPHCASN